MKTARSERQSRVAWVSAEGKRQVRVSLKPQHQNPIPSPQKQATQMEGWTDRWMDGHGHTHTKGHKVGFCEQGLNCRNLFW